MTDEQSIDLSAAVKAKATRHTAPPALRREILRVLDDATQEATPERRRPWAALMWAERLRLLGAFASGAVAASLLAVVFWNGGDDRGQLTDEIVANHVRSLMAEHLMDVASSDQHTVKPWFSGKLDYAPPVRDFAEDGYPLVGGRLDYLDHRQVSVLVYQRHKHTINLFVWPSGDVQTQAAQASAERGFNVVRWRRDGFRYWAVSDLEASELMNFAERWRE